MIRVLQSGWFIAFTGCALYLGTTAVVLRPSRFAGLQFIQPDYAAEDDPSWRFHNPEFNEWIAQFQNEKAGLDLRAQQLDEWQTRLNLELQEVSVATQTVAQLQSSFDQYVIRFKAQEADNVKHQAKLIAAMSPEGAVALLGQMSNNDVVRILFTMKPEEASLILDELSKMGVDQAKRAAQLTQRLHQVLPEPAPPTTPGIP